MTADRYRTLAEDHGFIDLVRSLDDHAATADKATNLFGSLNYLTIIQTDLKARLAIVDAALNQHQTRFLDFEKSHD